MTSEGQTRCGTIVLAGRPNAGKSTLLNTLVGTDLSIISPKPQSTRQQVVGIRTEAQHQLVIVDPPGLLEPHYLLQQTMLAEALRLLRSADAVLYLHRATHGLAPPLENLISKEHLPRRPIATVYTAIDQIGTVPPFESVPPEFWVSARTGEGLESLLAWCHAQIPVAPFRYHAEDVSTQPVRFFVAEFVREAALELLHEELPYAVAARVDEFRESADPVYIRVTIFVERASQKGMVIGAGGRTIKAIGASARRRVEELLGMHVYLDLWVKVLPHWRKSPQLLRELGYPPQA